MIKRICKNCKEEKPLSDFSKRDRYKGGHIPNCKKCESKRKSIWKLNNRETVNELQLKYYRKHPQKAKARTAVGHAIRDGKLIKEPCALCGDKEVEGHHRDYNKPLEVDWLCMEGHKYIHRLLKVLKEIKTK